MKAIKKVILAAHSILVFLKLKILFREKIKLSPINSISGQLKIDIDKKSKITIKKFIMTAGPLYIKAINGGDIRIGENVFFNHNCSVTSMDNIEIGNNSMFGNNLVIIDHNHIDTSRNKNKYTTSPITIGDDVWIGANCTILPGVKIGNNAIVGANSVVSKNIGNNEIWAGCPAKFIRRNEAKE